MVIERIRDTLGGDDGPSMTTTKSLCPKCGQETYVSEFEEKEGTLILDNIYCERGCQI